MKIQLCKKCGNCTRFSRRRISSNGKAKTGYCVIHRKDLHESCYCEDHKFEEISSYFKTLIIKLNE